MLTGSSARRVASVTGALVIAMVMAPGSASAGHWAGPFHLSDLNIASDRQIYIDDRTDSTWPVGASATEWDRSSKVLVRRLGCPTASYYCPPVHQVNNNNYWGVVVRPLNAEGTHITRDRSRFYANLSNITPLSRRRFVACQEEGHMIGLNHRTSQVSSCMWDNSPFAQLPDDHDFNELFAGYTHNDP
jgi:hypothetical protein